MYYVWYIIVILCVICYVLCYMLYVLCSVFCAIYSIAKTALFTVLPIITTANIVINPRLLLFNFRRHILIFFFFFISFPSLPVTLHTSHFTSLSSQTQMCPDHSLVVLPRSFFFLLSSARARPLNPLQASFPSRPS